ncbi:MAG: T9SS type A sorting domain-containing protein [Bacteroidales bacterium]|nr:T9SS type A sorting domain-containing protein [Bacteroidales bacterium]
MKKSLIIIMVLASTLMVVGQEKQNPRVFRNQSEFVQYQLDHPDQVTVNANNGWRAITGYLQKLDSVIGADDFDWTRWKNEYTYATYIGENDEQLYSDQLRTETSYLWNDNAWELNVKTESLRDGADLQTVISKWDGESWTYQSRVTYHYDVSNSESLLSSMVSERYVDSAWVLNTKSSYEYDSVNQLSLNQNFVYDEEVEGGWRANNKYTYRYDEQGALQTKLYSTIRNGNWRDSSFDTLMYDENHQCVEMLTRTKGGYGPGANQWRDASKYEFTYNDGQLESEIYYTASWFSSEMSLNHRTDYQFDERGNLLLKTASIFNGQDWVVRDTYENAVDLSVEAASILGLMPLWESTVSHGMGYVLGPSVAMNNQWRSCAIVSTNLDTQFDLYYSGFAAVEEIRPNTLKAFASGGRLVVESLSPADVVVYDMVGRVVASKSNALRHEFSLKPGLYFVSNGDSVVKAVVQ